jgi:hypothetical protein
VSGYGDLLKAWDEKTLKGWTWADELMTVVAGRDPATAVATVAKEILSLAPLMGGFYAQIVAEIPGLLTDFTDFLDDHWAKVGLERLNKKLGRYVQ